MTLVSNMLKVSIISGGASGLGYEIAVRLVRNGNNVVLLGRDEEKLEKASNQLKDTTSGVFAETVKCNVGLESDIKRLKEYLSERNMITEYLFNNAGIGLFTPADKLNSEMIDKVFEANVKGMMLLTSQILSITPKEEELTIINIMSTSALVGRAEETVYCAAKWGARGFTEALRAELKGTKRNVIAVYPGGMKTDFWKIQGQNRDISSFMCPALVADKIVNAVILSDKTLVTDITINRR